MTIRPLGAVSDFVRGRFPQELVLRSPLLPRRIEAMLSALSDAQLQFALESDHRSVASLDVKMLEAGLVHSGMELPAILTKLVDRFSGDELPMLLYQEIVLGNPRSDVRTFTDRAAGNTEAVFYLKHRYIEDVLDRVNGQVAHAIECLTSKIGVEEAIESLDTIGPELESVIRATSELGRMSRDHFATFRVYLNVHPVRNLKGPSGAFSAGIPLLELMTRGEQLDLKYLHYLDENTRYLPRQGRKRVQEAVASAQAGRTLSGLSRTLDQPVALREHIDRIRAFFTGFRNMHFGAVKRQLPEAIAGHQQGTGGETDVGAFLRSRMEQKQ